MSTWLDMVNDLKRRCSAEALTASQAAARQRLCQWMLMPEWINLCGPAGSGKTFLAWAVARATGATYISTPLALDDLEVGQSALIIDNAPHREDDVRRLLARCELVGAQTVLLVSRPATMLPMPGVELPFPTGQDIEQVKGMINRLGYFVDTERLPTSPCFWDVLRASV